MVYFLGVFHEVSDRREFLGQNLECRELFIEAISILSKELSKTLLYTSDAGASHYLRSHSTPSNRKF